MTRDQYIIRRKLNIVELGETLGNISEACRRLNISRQHYYDIKRVVEEEGVDGLLEKSRQVPRHGLRVASTVEDAILAYSLECPSDGHDRVANELKRRGIVVSASGVRCVWVRNGLTRRADRLRRLEDYAASEGSVLTERQVHALETAKLHKEAHGEIETHHPGFLVGQDTCYIGYIKGIGKIHQQTAIDTYSNVGFAKVYSDRNALIAADFLNDKVLPFFDQRGVKLLRMLTDRGTEYCGNAGRHPYQLFLHLNDIEHTPTKAYSPQTNGCTEKLNQTILDGFYATAFRKKVYRSLDEIQADLDEWMRYYNEERTNQGKHCKGRTPLETFLDGIALYEKLVHGGGDLH
jgi:transposase InsO family protein